MALTQLALGLVGASVIVNVIHTSWRHRQKAKQLGCKPLPAAPIRDPLAITNILEMIQADKEKRVPELLEERVETVEKTYGKYLTTYRLKAGLGESIVTFEPKNIQALLANQFKDFCIGSTREGCMGPLLGRGIVCCLSYVVSLDQNTNISDLVHHRWRRLGTLPHHASTSVYSRSDQ